MVMRATNNPWEGIGIPAGTGAISARRVDADYPYSFFWGKDVEGNYLLVLEYAPEVKSDLKRPKLNGIEIVEPPPHAGERRKLILRLISKENWELFYTLCTDILQAALACRDERSAVHVTIRRTWRWHQLLRGRGSGILDAESQKGLIGELRLLSHVLLRHFAPSDALNFWCGPQGAPKDFTIGATAVEVKCRRGTSMPYVSISNEHQLDSSGADLLFLYVVELAPIASGQTGAFTLADAVNEARHTIEELDSGSLELFEGRLADVGYFAEDDYSDHHWVHIATNVFRVDDGFPRIVAKEIPAGVSNVSYRISLVDCTSFSIDLDQFENQISGAPHG
jgi:hypothetical protein